MARKRKDYRSTLGIISDARTTIGIEEQLSLFNVFSASADCLQARQVCEAEGSIAIQEQISSGGGWFVQTVEEEPVFTCAVEAGQSSQICSITASLVLSASAEGLQKKQTSRSKAQFIAISDDEIIALLLAA